MGSFKSEAEFQGEKSLQILNTRAALIFTWGKVWAGGRAGSEVYEAMLDRNPPSSSLGEGPEGKHKELNEGKAELQSEVKGGHCASVRTCLKLKVYKEAQDEAQR